MSMLAEKRVKKRYNLQPRGKALYEDSNRFGTRMLEKMGWSKGKGLGANETGNKEFVRVKYKSDSIGLGFEERDDQWTQHDNDFNGLLRSLNGSEQNSGAEDDFMPKATGFGFQVEVEKDQGEVPQISGESLEEKSKKSKARVHYQKFTRGKDISRYSEKDLANIFGKKSLKVEKQFEEDVEKKEDHDSFGVTIVNAGTCIHDYFKEKMAMKKKIEEDPPEDYTQSNDAVLEEERVNFDEGKSQKKKKVERLVESNVGQELDESFKSKEKLTNKKYSDFRESNFNNSNYSKRKVVNDAEDVTESPNGSGQDEKNKKKLKNRRDATLCEAAEVEEKQGSAVKTVTKKRKRQDKIEDTRENEQDGNFREDQGSAAKTVSKKRKRQDKIEDTRENEQDGNFTEGQTNLVKTVTKKRKAKIEEMEESRENEQIGALMQDAECSVLRKKKKKKDKRNRHVNDKEELIQNERNVHITETSSNSVLNSREELKQTNEDESGAGSEYKNKLDVSTDHCQGSFEENRDPQFHPDEAILSLENLKAKSKKKNKNQKDKNQEETPSSDNTNSVDIIKDSENYCVFQLNGYHAEIFRYINFGSFKGSNFSEITGYGLSKNIKLEITSKRIDTEKIQNMWSKVLNKYTYKRKQNFKIKTAKKQNVFRIL